MYLPSHEMFTILADHYALALSPDGPSFNGGRAAALATTTRELAALIQDEGLSSRMLASPHWALVLLHYEYRTDPTSDAADKARAETLLEWAGILEKELSRRQSVEPIPIGSPRARAKAVGLLADDRAAASALFAGVAVVLANKARGAVDVPARSRYEAMATRFASEAGRLPEAGLGDLLERLAATDESALQLLGWIHGQCRRAFEGRVYGEIPVQGLNASAISRLAGGELPLVEYLDYAGSLITITHAGARLIEELGVAQRELPDGTLASLPIAQHTAIWEQWAYWAPRCSARGLAIVSCDILPNGDDGPLDLLMHELRSVRSPLYQGVSVDVDARGRVADRSEQLAHTPDMDASAFGRFVRDSLDATGRLDADGVASDNHRAIADELADLHGDADLGEALYTAHAEARRSTGTWITELDEDGRAHWAAVAKAAKALLLGSTGRQGA